MKYITAFLMLFTSFSVNSDPCYTNVSGINMQLANGTIESCMRVIRASGNSVGQWGNHTIEFSDGQFYVDGELFGTPRSSREEGTAVSPNKQYNLEQRNWDYYRYHQAK